LINQKLSSKNWQDDIDKIKDSIVFIDEGNKWITSNDFAGAIKTSDNYYVIITRESLSGLPFDIVKL
jgi:hypothetical protein